MSGVLPSPAITGDTELIAHIGYPTYTFKSPSIYNPYFAHAGIDCVLVPFACEAEHYPALLRTLFEVRNLRGAVITMPHKVSTLSLVDTMAPRARIAGSCNAVRRLPDGRLEADMFDGVGFVAALERAGFRPEGTRAYVKGTGGVGCAIAAALASAGVAAIDLCDVSATAAAALGGRISEHCPRVTVRTDVAAPAGHHLVVNATPIGMRAEDPLPMPVDGISAGAFVCDVVLAPGRTPFLAAAAARGAHVQDGAEMLFEQIPAYLKFFGFPPSDAETLRRIAADAASAASPAAPTV